MKESNSNKEVENKYNKVKVVMDFDGTLSYGRRSDGKKNSSIASLRDGGYLSEEYDKAAHALHDKYYAIEKDHALSHDIRLTAMHEWWNAHSQLLVDSGLTRDMMELAGRSHYVLLRPGIKELFNFLKEQNIDAYIFTAGRRELIYYTLLEEGIDIEEDHIIGNYFIYDKNSNAVNYNRPQITSMDKDESVILDINNNMYDNIRAAFARDLEIGSQENKIETIILGDGEGDAKMVNPIHSHSQREGGNTFRIGFFNMSPDEAHYEERLAHFKNIYDIVLPAAASLSYVIKIIKENKIL